MIHEEKKVAKIIEELTLFFFSVGGDKMSSKIEMEKERITIRFRSNYSEEYEEDIAYLEEYLNNEQRNAGIGDIYWELAGSSDPLESSQLLLLSMMIDGHEIHRFEQEIEVCLYKVRSSS